MVHPCLAALRERAAESPRRIVLPESDDARIVEAAALLADQGLAVPVFLEAPTTSVAGAVVLEREDQACIDETLNDALAARAEADRESARGDRYFRAAAAVRAGLADAGVAGANAVTADVLRAGLRVIGLAEPGGLISSLFLMLWPDRVLSFADCAVVPEPDPRQLASIARDSAAAHAELTGEAPGVALLSFSTHGSAVHPRAAAVAEAVRMLRRDAPDLVCDGEIQFDAAMVPEVAARKAPDSPLAGRANVLVFPSLEAGNIGYKIAQRLGGAQAVGPVVQGFARPWMDLSRGCSAAEVLELCVIAACRSFTGISSESR